MHNSVRLIKAIGDISDDKIEKAGRALGYQKEQRRANRVPVRMGRALSIAAVVALILALGVTAYAIYVHWSRGMEQRLPATDAEKEMAEQSGLSDTSQTVSATANGVTISVEQTVIDGDTALIALSIGGFHLDSEQELDAMLWNCSLTFDGDTPPAWGGSFVEERDANGRVTLTAAGGYMEYNIWVRAGEKLDTLAGKEIRIVIKSMGIGGLKSEYQPLVEGPWELVWTPNSNSEQLTVQPDAAIDDTGAKLISGEVGPISAKVSLKLPAFWEGYKTLDHYDLQLVGVRLKDGTVLINIFGPPTQEGYTDMDNLILNLEYSSHQILRPDQVDALIFAHDSPWARTLIDDELMVIPIV